MTANFVEQRSGPRYLVHINVRAEWDDESSGEHVVVEGETENIGPRGALVHLEKLPDVGSRVQIIVPEIEGKKVNCEALAEVIRLERNPVQPLAALQLIGESDEWRGLVWEPAAELERKPDKDYEDYDN
jgi:hypothetical protein